MHDYYALYYETCSLNIACQTKPDFLCVLTSNLLLWQIKRMSNIYNVCINWESLFVKVSIKSNKELEWLKYSTT